jgi:hypothetical protein
MNRWNYNLAGLLASLVALSAVPNAVSAPTKAKKAAPADSTMNIKAGQGGKDFESITVEGEDRVRVQFERPPLKIDIDPASAPGLDWESVWDVLGASSFDFVDPLLERPVFERTPYAPRPWLDAFHSGPVARFHPEVSGVEKWSLEVADSRGKTVARFGGDGKPPKEIAWDGATTDGTPARADLTYSYVLNASDKAGNKRSFLGDSFKVPPRVVESKDGVGMSFSIPADASEVSPAVALEVASRLNQAGDATKPVRVEVTAPTAQLAKAIADDVVAALAQPAGDPARVTTVTNVTRAAATGLGDDPHPALSAPPQELPRTASCPTRSWTRPGTTMPARRPARACQRDAEAPSASIIAGTAAVNKSATMMVFAGPSAAKRTKRIAIERSQEDLHRFVGARRRKHAAQRLRARLRSVFEQRKEEQYDERKRDADPEPQQKRAVLHPHARESLVTQNGNGNDRRKDHHLIEALGQRVGRPLELQPNTARPQLPEQQRADHTQENEHDFAPRLCEGRTIRVAPQRYDARRRPPQTARHRAHPGQGRASATRLHHPRFPLTATEQPNGDQPGHRLRRDDGPVYTLLPRAPLQGQEVRERNLEQPEAEEIDLGGCHGVPGAVEGLDHHQLPRVEQIAV